MASVTSEQFRESPVSAPATIRLFFHDCFVDVILRFLVTHRLFVCHLHQIAWFPQPRIIFLSQIVVMDVTDFVVFLNFACAPTLKGCDASILISTTPGGKDLAERDAEDNKDLAIEAFDSIKKVKALVEGKCPGVVSCADIQNGPQFCIC